MGNPIGADIKPQKGLVYPLEAFCLHPVHGSFQSLGYESNI
jgi:hypothetical protein